MHEWPRMASEMVRLTKASAKLRDMYIRAHMNVVCHGAEATHGSFSTCGPALRPDRECVL